jgi:cytochrome P450
MLEDGELSPWVQTIFAAFKVGTFWRCVMQYSAITNWLVAQLLFNSKQARVKQWENFEYCQSRMDKRLAREPAHSDLWSRILSKSDSAESLSRDEYHSNAVTFMVAGERARVWAVRFSLLADLVVQGPRLLLRPSVV